MKIKIIFVVIGMLFMGILNAENTIIKISALASGKLLLNGQDSSLPTIETELKNTKGVVWYFRENPQSEPPPEAMAVIELVVKYKLPISMSSKPDFSDYIDENGNSKPRKP